MSQDSSRNLTTLDATSLHEAANHNRGVRMMTRFSGSNAAWANSMSPTLSAGGRGFRRWCRGSKIAMSIFLGACVAACAPTVENPEGRRTAYISSDRSGAVRGVGIESQDIVSITDEMMRSIASSGLLADHEQPPRIIIDSRYFENVSSQAIDKNLIVDRLRTELIRAAQGRLTFVSRENIDMVEKERQLKRTGKTDIGTTGLTKATAGADYRLAGRVKSLDSRNSQTGLKQRYTQITFELIDLESGVVRWGDQFEFRKAGQDDVIYR